MTVGLQIETEERPPIIILRLDGRLDATSAPSLEGILNTHVSKQNGKILLDFSRIEYLSSAGMRLLLSISKKAKTQNGIVALCAINDDVMEIIKMAGFERILQIYATEMEALNQLK